MSIVLMMEPRTPPMTWKQFCRQTEPYAVGGDGYVIGGPRVDLSGPRANFNHHEDVDRLATRATCAQVLMAIRQGFFNLFRDSKGPRAVVYLNDCDEDVCTTAFLLENGHLVEHAMNPALNRLVAMEDALDTTAGAYPYPKDLPTLRKLAWVFEPYRRARSNGTLEKKDATTYTGIVTDVMGRIMQHITSGGGEIDIDTAYERIYDGPGWAMVKEIGANARTGMFSDGIRAFVAERARPDGNHTYTVGRMSPFIPFPLDLIFKALNEVEGGTEKWGGGDTIGGSPRVQGSKLQMSEVASIINEVLETNRP